MEEEQYGVNGTEQMAKPNKNIDRSKFNVLLQRLKKVKWLNWLATAIAVFIMPFIFQSMIELVRMGSVSSWLEYIWQHKGVMLPSYILLVIISAAICFASLRPWVSNLIVGAILLIMASVNYFKLLYRGEPFLPRDMVQAGEGLKMTHELKIGFSREIWLFFFLLVFSTIIFLPFRVPLNFEPNNAKAIVFRVGTFVLCMAISVLTVFNYFGNEKLIEKNHGIVIRSNSMPDTYYQNTFLSSFLYFTANLKQEKPQNYSQKTMMGIKEEMPLPKENNPDIILVLLESYFNLEKIPGTSYSEDIMANYKLLQQESISGYMLGDKRGGGTSDYEFQVATGFNISFMPQGAVPMIEFVFENMPCLPTYLHDNNYRTVGVHPFDKTFYRRNISYPKMNINEFYAMDDFVEPVTAGVNISDKSFAQRIIEEYEKSLKVNENIYIHAISMQNHTPHTEGIYPENYRVNAKSGISSEYDGVLSTYATGVRDSDEVIKILTDYFKTVDRDVIVIFYGDHQVPINPEGMDDIWEVCGALDNASEEEIKLAKNTTPFLIWANYEQQQEDVGLVAPYMLMPLAVKYYNANAPEWMCWLAENFDKAKGVSGGYYITEDNRITEQMPNEQKEYYDKYRLIQYDLLFGKKYLLSSFAAS